MGKNEGKLKKIEEETNESMQVSSIDSDSGDAMVVEKPGKTRTEAQKAAFLKCLEARKRNVEDRQTIKDAQIIKKQQQKKKDNRKVEEAKEYIDEKLKAEAESESDESEEIVLVKPKRNKKAKKKVIIQEESSSEEEIVIKKRRRLVEKKKSTQKQKVEEHDSVEETDNDIKILPDRAPPTYVSKLQMMAAYGF